MTKSYSEILISNEPDSELFKSLSDRLKSEFKAELIDRVEDLDSKYFDFKIKDNILTLHLQNYIGITLFPKDLNDSTEKANLLAETVGFKLKYSTCSDCFKKYVENEDYLTEIEGLEKIKKTS